MWSWQQTQSTEELVERGEFGSLSHCSLVMETCTIKNTVSKLIHFNPHTHTHNVLTCKLKAYELDLCNT